MNRTLKLTFLTFCIALSSGLAYGDDEVDYLGQYNQCIKKNAPINSSVVLECSAQVSEAAKKEITLHYKFLFEKLTLEDPIQASKLETTQKSWIKYRNGHCELATSLVGSPMYGYCPMSLNIERAIQLRQLSGN